MQYTVPTNLPKFSHLTDIELLRYIENSNSYLSPLIRELADRMHCLVEFEEKEQTKTQTHTQTQIMCPCCFATIDRADENGNNASGNLGSSS